MKDTIDIKQSITTADHIERVSFPCPKCDKSAEADIMVVLTSDPPQYSYYCPYCESHGSVLCSEVDNYRFNIKKAWDVEKPSELYRLKCSICGDETTFGTEANSHYICENCKEAVIAMRKALGTWHD